MTAASTDPERLAGLADRCEAASGADRELDLLIHFAVDPEASGELAAWTDPALVIRSLTKYGTYPAYTASLDAAMSLLPEGLRLQLGEWDDETHLRPRGPWQAILTKAGSGSTFDDMRGFRCDHAATPALALCAAALRARAHQETRP